VRGVGGDREEVGSGLPARARAAHRLAIEGEGFAIAQRARLLDPTRQRPLHMSHRQPRQQAPIERPRRRQMAAGSAHPRQHRPLIPRPASDGLQRAAIAQERRRQAGQQEGQIIALPASFARVGDRREGRGQGARMRVREQLVAPVR